MDFDFKLGKIYVNNAGVTVEVGKVTQYGIMFKFTNKSDASYYTDPYGKHDDEDSLSISRSIDGDEEAKPKSRQRSFKFEPEKAPTLEEIAGDTMEKLDIDPKQNACLFATLPRLAMLMDALSTQDKIGALAFLTTRIKIKES